MAQYNLAVALEAPGIEEGKGPQRAPKVGWDFGL